MKLEIGYSPHFEVRREEYPTGSADDLSILYLSDLHFNAYSKTITARLIETVNELDPTIILLGGDYVDSKKGLMYLNELLNVFSDRKHVFAIAGNHDHFRGIYEIQRIMNENKVQWIEKQSVMFKVNDLMVQLDGNKASLRHADADIAVLCLHKPADIATDYNYDLVFAGHLHGSQVVLWQRDKALFPGKLFYKWNILEKRSGPARYFISKGLGDTLPVRYNCKKDVIFVELVAMNTIQTL